MPWLVALDGGLAGRRFPLETTFLVGRGPFNHAVLDDVRISRQHAKIAHEVDGLVVYDLGSSNGTYVNDNAVKRHILTPGDLVRFGPFRFRFEADPAESSSTIGRRAKQEEMTRVGFEAPTKIVGETDAQVPQTFVSAGGLADLEEADRRLRTLFSFVHAIAVTLEPSALVDLIADNLFQSFPSSTLAAVYVLDKDSDTMEAKRVRTRDGREVPHYPLPAELYLEIVQNGKALLSTPLSLDWDDDRPVPGMALLMHAPMVYRGSVLGVLNVRCDPGSSFSQGDLDLLTALASHAALALKNTTLHQESLEQQRLQRDLSLAQQIQKSFLPLSLPEAAGLTFVAEYHPAYSVGGDFYDVFWQAPERIGCIIGDVSGKGVAAALLMARVSSDLRTAMLTATGPAAALSRVNRELVARGQHDIFVTAVALTIHVPTRKITLASAGHMPPYVRRAQNGELVRIEEGASSPLGLFDDMPYDETEVTLTPGDTVVLTTDGVHEATNPSGDQLGFEGVERALRAGRSEPHDVAERILAAVRDHAMGAPQYDDLTLVLCGTTH
ncbi:MAG: SpoIIE family protein phosphatase [Polyangiaceae bacterium]|nr:SpoIIE family protein phosphatase [Polyangiaceae bacterium]